MFESGLGQPATAFGHWLAGCFSIKTLLDSNLVYIGPSPKGEKEKSKDR